MCQLFSNDGIKTFSNIRPRCVICKWIKGSGANSIGEILLNIDDQHITEAEYWIKRSIETNQKYGMMGQLARDYALYTELYKLKVDLPKAKKNLSKAIEISSGCGADGWVGKY